MCVTYIRMHMQISEVIVHRLALLRTVQSNRVHKVIFYV